LEEALADTKVDTTTSKIDGGTWTTLFEVEGIPWGYYSDDPRYRFYGFLPPYKPLRSTNLIYATFIGRVEVFQNPIGSKAKIEALNKILIAAYEWSNEGDTNQESQEN
jgi:hypothetical protein